MRCSCVGGTSGCTMYTSRCRQLAWSCAWRQSLLKRVISTGDSGTSRSRQMAWASGRWAEPLKTTTSRTGTGTPGLGRAVGVRVTRHHAPRQGPSGTMSGLGRGRYQRPPAAAALPSVAPPGPSPGGALHSCPELTLEGLLGLVDRALVGAGGQVLPAAVGHHERDVGALARPHRLGGLGEGGMEDGARRDAGEDPLAVEQLAHPAHGVAGPDREPGVDQGLVVQLGDEALVEVA